MKICLAIHFNKVTNEDFTLPFHDTRRLCGIADKYNRVILPYEEADILVRADSGVPADFELVSASEQTVKIISVLLFFIQVILMSVACSVCTICSLRALLQLTEAPAVPGVITVTVPQYGVVGQRSLKMEFAANDIALRAGELFCACIVMMALRGIHDASGADVEVELIDIMKQVRSTHITIWLCSLYMRRCNVAY